MGDTPCSIRPIAEQKRVIPTLPSHFSWGRPRVMVNGFWLKRRVNAGVLSLAGLGVEKKDDESTTPDARMIGFLEYVLKSFLDCLFLSEESFVHVSFFLSLSVCFCTCFQ